MTNNIVLKNRIDNTNYDDLLLRISTSIKKNKSLLISPIASQTITLAYQNKNLKKTLDKFDHLAPDSQWLKWSIFFLYGKRLKKRVYGPDLMLKACRLAEHNGYHIFLYGTKSSTLKKLKNELKLKFKYIKIVGSSPSKFRDLEQNEKNELVVSIIKTQTQILFIGIGSPKQEILSVEIEEMLKKKNKSAVIIPVGAAFDFISKSKPQAPYWVQYSGLEWMFRLLNEPKRLWRRYIIYGPLFLFFVLKQKIHLL